MREIPKSRGVARDCDVTLPIAAFRRIREIRTVIIIFVDIDLMTFTSICKVDIDYAYLPLKYNGHI